MSLEVALWGANVHPVSARRNVRKEKFALLKQLWEEAVLERMVFAAGNQIEHLRIQHIGAGVDVLAGGHVGFRLLQKAAHAAVSFGFDDAVGARVFDRSQNDSCYGVAVFMFADHRLQIEISQNVALENNPGLAN